MADTAAELADVADVAGVVQRSDEEPGTVPTLRQVLDGVRRLAPTLAARAGEIEAARRLPPDMVAELAAIGCFRVTRPTSHGGVECDVIGGLEVVEALSRADGSVGWTVMIGAGSWIDVAGLPRASFDSLFSGGGSPIMAGVFNPTGTSVAVDGGYEVTGRWAFASGCQHAQWIFANTIEAGAEPGESHGPPPMRMVVFSPADVEIEDTWRVSGLCGTGSHHFSATRVVIPAERTAATLLDPPCVDSPFVRVPPPPLYSLFVASVAVGIAGAAYDDVVALAGGKVPLLSPAPLAANPLFHHQLGTANAQLRAARTLLYSEAAALWDVAERGDELDPEHRARIRATTTWVAATAAAVVDAAYTAAGGSAIQADNPLQRRFRDVHAVTQHFLVRPDTLTTAGAVLAGQDVDLTVF
jgi:alkylation response protein AidB-like acyl-CoA dehydrogenase